MALFGLLRLVVPAIGLLLLSGCLREPDLETRSAYFYLPYPSGFSDHVDAYTPRLIDISGHCFPHPIDHEKVAVWFIDLLPGMGAQFSPDHDIFIDPDVDRPLAYYGHEYCRYLCYRNGYNWQQSSQDWSAMPIGCCWQEAETLAVTYDRLQ